MSGFGIYRALFYSNFDILQSPKASDMKKFLLIIGFITSLLAFYELSVTKMKAPEGLSERNVEPALISQKVTQPEDSIHRLK